MAGLCLARAGARDGDVVGSSTLFDAAGYTARAGGLAGLDPALHYVLVGEGIGLAPSAAFDPEYYRHRNPDLSGAAINLFHHYLALGRAEGRRGISVSETLTFDRQRLDTSRETILLFAHDASRTGAPIIAYHIARRLQQTYNVVAVLLGAGELFPVFESCCAAVVGPIPQTEWCDVESQASGDASVRVLSRALRHREQHRNADGAPCAGPRSRPGVSPSFTSSRRIPARPGAWPGARLVDPGWCSLQRSSPPRLRENIPRFAAATVHVLPQGTCPAPLTEGAREAVPAVDALLELRRQKDREHALVVFGCGTVHLRKGVDLFSAVRGRGGQARPETSGAVRVDRRGYRPEHDHSYSCYLADQIERSGSGRHHVDDRMPSPTWNRRMRWLMSSSSVRGWIRCRT
jgi:hypothetical protein